ncbi:unnamed protein product [Amoebophrya sp. A120]|nr:unnamed protein product [Amoebophrya sp. A120]|eukprot:GSA120T00005939001.1
MTNCKRQKMAEHLLREVQPGSAAATAEVVDTETSLQCKKAYGTSSTEERRNMDGKNRLLLDNDELLALIHRAEWEKNRLRKPEGSQFRVVCLVRYFPSKGARSAGDGDSVQETAAGSLEPDSRCFDSTAQIAVGANMESTGLCSGVCAERVALTHLRTVDQDADVQQLVILTDSPDFIAPGAMCREFMAEHFGIYEKRVPIYLVASKGEVSKNGASSCDSAVLDADADPDNVRVVDDHTTSCTRTNTSWRHTVCFMQDLWRFRCCFIGQKRDDCEAFGGEVSKCCEPVVQRESNNAELDMDVLSPDQARARTSPLPHAESFRALYERIREKHREIAAQRQGKPHYHPLFLVAGAMTLSRRKTFLAAQTQSIEYPGSVDAVSKVLVFLEKEQEDLQLASVAGDENKSVVENNDVLAAHHKFTCTTTRRLDQPEAPVLILLVDQFGICHAPAAPARAYFAEQGNFEFVHTLVHDIPLPIRTECEERSASLSGSDDVQKAPRFTFPLVHCEMKNLYDATSCIIDWKVL